jgi:hypothetical protein
LSGPATMFPPSAPKSCKFARESRHPLRFTRTSRHVGEGGSKCVFRPAPGSAGITEETRQPRRGGRARSVRREKLGFRAQAPRRGGQACRLVAWPAGSLAAPGESCSSVRVHGVGELADGPVEQLLLPWRSPPAKPSMRTTTEIPAQRRSSADGASADDLLFSSAHPPCAPGASFSASSLAADRAPPSRLSELRRGRGLEHPRWPRLHALNGPDPAVYTRGPIAISSRLVERSARPPPRDPAPLCGRSGGPGC